jgi:predicted dienelactone hydrolase
MKTLITCITLLAAGTLAMADNRIDTIRPDAPELAAFGDHAVGVKTLQLVNENQIDILKVADGDLPRGDRALTVELFYPASEAAEPTPLNAFMRDGETEVQLHGISSRDAAADIDGGPWPLAIISHGYPGNRFLLSHLAENLASKGYVVASIDHTDSTYRDKAVFGSTLVNRPLDQLFVLDELARQSAAQGTPVSGLINAERTVLIGYSMGAYGAVIVAGGGVTSASTELSWGAPAGTLAVHLAGSDTHKQLFDDRIAAVVAIAPWGMERGFWDADGLAGVRIPTLFVAGSEDDVSGYETGIRAIWQQSTGADRHLLTFDNANHNAAAPYPAPAESVAMNEALGFAPFDHYADAVWDTARMNNILQHFVTAFAGRHIKQDEAFEPYLQLQPIANEGVWAVAEDGTKKPEHTHWHGFANRTAKGLRFEFIGSGE